MRHDSTPSFHTGRKLPSLRWWIAGMLFLSTVINYGIEIHPWQSGNLRLIGIHRNYGLSISELGPPEYQKQDALEAPLELKITFGKAMSLYDTREGKFLGNLKEYRFSLDKTQPTLLATLPSLVSKLFIDAPRMARAGERVRVNLVLQASNLTGAHTFRVQVLDPTGKELKMLSRNLSAPSGKALWVFPLAVDAAKGTHTLQCRDIATGIKATGSLTVE